MSCLEAMTNGLPMLCRADEALDGVVEHGRNGLIYDSGEEFVRYVCRILNDDPAFT